MGTLLFDAVATVVWILSSSMKPPWKVVSCEPCVRLQPNNCAFANDIVRNGPKLHLAGYCRVLAWFPSSAAVDSLCHVNFFLDQQNYIFEIKCQLDHLGQYVFLIFNCGHDHHPFELVDANICSHSFLGCHNSSRLFLWIITFPLFPRNLLPHAEMATGGAAFVATFNFRCEI